MKSRKCSYAHATTYMQYVSLIGMCCMGEHAEWLLPCSHYRCASVHEPHNWLGHYRCAHCSTYHITVEQLAIYMLVATGNALYTVILLYVTVYILSNSVEPTAHCSCSSAPRNVTCAVWEKRIQWERLPTTTRIWTGAVQTTVTIACYLYIYSIQFNFNSMINVHHARRH